MALLQHRFFLLLKFSGDTGVFPLPFIGDINLALLRYLHSFRIEDGIETFIKELLKRVSSHPTGNFQVYGENQSTHS